MPWMLFVNLTLQCVLYCGSFWLTSVHFALLEFQSVSLVTWRDKDQWYRTEPFVTCSALAACESLNGPRQPIFGNLAISFQKIIIRQCLIAIWKAIGKNFSFLRNKFKIFHFLRDLSPNYHIWSYGPTISFFAHFGKHMCLKGFGLI